MVASARLEATQDSFFRNQPEKLVSRSIIQGTILNWKPIFLLLNNEQRERWGNYFKITIMLMFDDLSIMVVNDLSLVDDITYKPMTQPSWKTSSITQTILLKKPAGLVASSSLNQLVCFSSETLGCCTVNHSRQSNQPKANIFS